MIESIIDIYKEMKTNTIAIITEILVTVQTATTTVWNN
jgi:hypothetical protein